MIVGEIYQAKNRHHSLNNKLFGRFATVNDNDDFLNNTVSIDLYDKDLVICISKLITRFYTTGPFKEVVEEEGYVCLYKNFPIFIEERHINGFIHIRPD